LTKTNPISSFFQIETFKNYLYDSGQFNFYTFDPSLYFEGIAAHIDYKHVASLQNAFRGVQLVIFDELSLINLEQLWEINIKLKIASNDKAREQKLFGGFHILLGGDLFQLPP
jgi:hypothetical protein